MKADGGTVTVLGIDAAKDPQAIQSRISYMPQKFGLYDDLTVRENLDLYADLHGVTADEKRTQYARLMEMTGLDPFQKRLAGKLSGGMKQKLGLACTLVRSPNCCSWTSRPSGSIRSPAGSCGRSSANWSKRV
jgi:ABC-2 type transport system ATP-binding protein